MPPRVDSVALLERTMQMIRETHADWDEDQVLERAFSVMNLQPNTNQAEKIPKSVLSIISQIVKLNENNWAIWEPMFMDCIHPIKDAKRILTREIPSGHTDYDEELDSHLLGLILSSCDHGPTSRIDTYTVRGQGGEEQLGSTLYKKLEAALTINDEVKLSAIHDRVHEVKLVHRNIINLGKELDQIWNDAARLGSRMDEKLKKSTLYRCIKDDWLYTQTVDSLKAAQPGCSYEYAYHTLAKKHQEAELSGRIRAAARATSNRNTTGQPSWPGQILNQEGCDRGRRDPANPNEPAVMGRNAQEARGSLVHMEGAQKSAETYDSISNEHHPLSSRNLIVAERRSSSIETDTETIAVAHVWSPPQFGFESLEAEGTRPKTDSDEPELVVEVLDVEDPLPKIYTLLPTDPTDDNRSELDVEEMIGEAHTAVLNLTPTLKEALASDDVQQWQEAICKELDGLEAMGTWEIVDVPPNTRLVDSKIVLRLKLDADGIPIRHKARLVAQGFTQREGIDFEETFAPVAPLSAIRALLSLAVERNWEVHQLDITMAYLNSTLNHVIYMKPPEGAKVPNGKAYRVVKGLYGLKQSGREWNMEFDKFLRHSNFHRLDCAPCIYTRGRGDNFAIVVIYVDDTLIIAPTLGTVKRIKEEIGQRWRMEDGGNVSHFLGIKITRDREAKTMDLEQTSYVKQLLDEHLDKHRRKSSVPLQDIPVLETAASIAE
ncbi:uncharacterized protein UHOD_11400 [Ustilago sp. UG-2017b]|nr:uncharacterized protein UHOD_11400 [Ustilago sp. UG-2017b]